MPCTVKAFLNLRVPMRDGTNLGTHVYLPDAEGPFPVLLVRTPYDAMAKGQSALEWPGRGYAYVAQDVRGRFLSEGEYSPYRPDVKDGEDTLKWIAAQPWCDGNIAMYGGSYPAATQLAAAMSGHPALKCITPCLIGLEPYHASYWGGAFRLKGRKDEGTIIHPDIPIADREEAYIRDVLRHPFYDDFWKAFSISQCFDKVRATSFIRTGWFDIFLCDAFDLFNGLRQRASPEARKYTRILVGPWPHNINQREVGEVNFGPEATIADLYEQEIAYIDQFTRGKAGYDLDAAPLRLFIMGPNVWRDEHEWPLARTVWTEKFLAGGGKANTSNGDGKLCGVPSGASDRFDYDPANPVPTKGGAWAFADIGPYDQTEIEKRPDVLVYTSETLDADVEVTGPVEVRLFASSSARDTDFTAKLVDAGPDGKAMSITDGIIRARYRNPSGPEQFLVPGQVSEFTIKCNPTAYVFRKGHRIRLEISSSNWPAFTRNRNTGNDITTDTEMQVARQQVFHSPEYPSRLILPVIPKD